MIKTSASPVASELIEKFEADARRLGYSNFAKNGPSYAHAELQTLYLGWLMGRKSK